MVVYVYHQAKKKRYWIGNTGTTIPHHLVAAGCLKIFSQRPLTGWWYTYPSEQYEFVSWDDYSQHMGKKQMFQTTNQTKV
jgi:hypothetical protein